MPFSDPKHLLLHILRAWGIARRYLITNGFDGSLTMLGMMTGFYTSGMTELPVAINACLGAAVALFVSGLCSAYLSEKAEREKELQELEQALLHDLGESDYGHASRYLPFLVALANGLAPLIFSVLIIAPLQLAEHGFTSTHSPFLDAIAIALCCIFLLGVFLGKISKSHWFMAGVRTLLIAAVTMAIIFLFGHNG